MNWHIDWQDAVVLLLAIAGIAAAVVVRRRTSRQGCQGCALRGQHGSPTPNG